MTHVRFDPLPCAKLVLAPFLILLIVLGGTDTRIAAQTSSGNNAARANSYDDAWQDGPNGWVANARAILAGGSGQVTGLVLWIGDSLTRDPALGAWAQRGVGKTVDDQIITDWMHAGLSPQSIDSIDGFTLATPYICSARSYTVGDGLGSWHFMGNGMPADTNPATARQKLQDCATYPNILNLQTMLTALPKAQFAIPEVNLDAAQPERFPDFERMVDLMIANHIVPIIITYTYRQDAQFNALVDRYNTALVQYARSKKLPLIDFNNEMLARLPFSQWMGRFLGDGVHYTHGTAQYPSTSSPYADGGDPATHTTGLPLTYNGYGLKGWLGVQKMKEIKQLVIDNAPPSPAPAEIVSPAQGSTLTSSSQTFTWSSGTGVSSYRLDVGNTAGAADIYAGTPTTILSAQVTGLPTDGRTIWVRLSSSISGAWQTRDYTYKAVRPLPISGAISIKFVGTGVAMTAVESGGVVAKTNWNNAPGAARGTPLALTDETGASTGAAVTWSADNAWSTPITDAAGNRRLMKGYLDNGSEGLTTVNVTGLASATYDIYVYADGDNGGAARTGGYRISGAGIATTTINLTDAANTNFNAAFVAANNSAGNYAKFSGVTIAGNEFTLTATPGASSTGPKRAPVNGIQIIPTPSPDFTMTATPGSRSTTQGSGASYTVDVGASNGFGGTVSFQVSGLPANATASFTPPSVTGSGGAALNVTTAVNTPSGTFTLTISGTSGALTHTTTVSLVVNAPPPDFTIAATPGSRTASQGASAIYTVNVGALNAFAGTVGMSVSGLPANATASFTPPSVTGAGSATLNVTTAANTPPGNSTLTISGTSGSIVHATTVTLTVSAVTSRGAIGIDFAGNGTSMGAIESAGVVAKTNWNSATGATRTTPLPLKDDAGGATGATVVWTSDNVWSTPITDQPGNRRLMKGYLDTGTERATTVTVAGLPAGAYDVYVYTDGDNAGATRTASYRISGAGITTTTISVTDAPNTNFNTAFTAANNSTGNFVKFAINATGFTLTATPGTSSSGGRRAPVNGIQIVPSVP